MGFLSLKFMGIYFPLSIFVLWEGSGRILIPMYWQPPSKGGFSHGKRWQRGQTRIEFSITMAVAIANINSSLTPLLALLALWEVLLCVGLLNKGGGFGESDLFQQGSPLGE